MYRVDCTKNIAVYNYNSKITGSYKTLVNKKVLKNNFFKLTLTLSYLLPRFVKYYPFAVTFLGSLGNCVSVLVFFGTKLRNQSSSYYLSSLAISDTLFLLLQVVPELKKIGIGIFQINGYCQFFIYIAQVTQSKLHKISTKLLKMYIIIRI